MSQLTEQEKKKKKLTPAEVFYHEQKIGEIEQEFIAFQNELNNKQERVREWAERLEALITAGKLELELFEISAYISNRMVELKVEITPQWVQESLKGYPQYKNPDYNRNPGGNNGQTNSVCLNVKLPNINKLKDGGALQSAYDEDAKLEAQIKALSKYVNDHKKEVALKAQVNHFQLEDNKKDPVTTPHGDPKLSQTLMVWCDHIETLGGYIHRDSNGLPIPEKLAGIAEEMYQYPPSHEEDGEIAAGIRGWDEVFKPAGDQKFTQSMPDWFDMLDYFYGHGKHAAGTQWKVEKPMVLYDKATDSFKTIPIEPREYTREHVGDHAEAIEAKRDNFYKAIPIISAIVRWHRNFAEPNRGERKTQFINPRWE